MKKPLKAYTSYTSTERMGIIAFSVILLALIIIKTTMHLWVTPNVTSQSMNNVLQHYNSTQHGAAIVDLNAADSATLVSVKGIGPAIAHKILVRRATIGTFTSIEQLLDVYHFPKDDFEVLKQQLQVNTNRH